MRGRLIQPFKVTLARFNSAATAADPDGAGPLESGFDEVFRETVLVEDASNEQFGVSSMKYDEVVIDAQIEPKEFELLNHRTSGMANDSKFTIVAHFSQLERLGLVDDKGNARFNKGDKLLKIAATRGNLETTIDDPPGLYLVECYPTYGIGQRRNLLVMRFWDRKQAGRGVGEKAD